MDQLSPLESLDLSHLKDAFAQLVEFIRSLQSSNDRNGASLDKVHLPIVDVDLSSLIDVGGVFETLNEMFSDTIVTQLGEVEAVLEQLLTDIGLTGHDVKLAIDTSLAGRPALRIDFSIDKVTATRHSVNVGLEALQLNGVGDLLGVGGSAEVGPSCGRSDQCRTWHRSSQCDAVRVR